MYTRYNRKLILSGKTAYPKSNRSGLLPDELVTAFALSYTAQFVSARVGHTAIGEPDQWPALPRNKIHVAGAWTTGPPGGGV